MTELDTYLGKIGAWKKTTWSLMMVALMIFSTTLAALEIGAEEEVQEIWGDSVQRTAVQTASQYDQSFRDREVYDTQPTSWSHPALYDLQYLSLIHI